MSAPVEPTREALEKFRARCFWWVSVEVALLDLPRAALIRGLQTYGGREGMELAAQLPTLVS